MSKNNRKERKVNALSDLSTIVDVASLPAADQSPAETGVPETAETSNLENYEGSGDVQEFPNDQVEPAVEQAIAESSTVKEAAAAFVEPDKSEEPVVAAKEIPAEALKLIEALQAQINLLKTTKASRKVASGSKARPNVTYTLLAKPPAWHSTPQVAQLQQILFDPAFLEAHKQADGSIKVSEPDLFAQVVAGHAAGILRTRQEPIRILQYYRSDLLNADCLRWQ